MLVKNTLKQLGQRNGSFIHSPKAAYQRGVTHCQIRHSPQGSLQADVSSRTAILELRAETGVSLRLCKEALETAKHDPVQARIVLKDMVSSQVEKLAARNGEHDTLREGAVAIFDMDENSKVIFKLLCRSDFVARSPRFAKLASDIFALQLKSNVTPGDYNAPIESAIGALMEPIKLADMRVVQKMSSHIFGTYLHHKYSKGLASVAALVVVDPKQCEIDDAQSFTDNIARHVAGNAPNSLEELLQQPFMFSDMNESVSSAQERRGVQMCEFIRLAVK